MCSNDLPSRVLFTLHCCRHVTCVAWEECVDMPTVRKWRKEAKKKKCNKAADGVRVTLWRNSPRRFLLPACGRVWRDATSVEFHSTPWLLRFFAKKHNLSTALVYGFSRSYVLKYLRVCRVGFHHAYFHLRDSQYVLVTCRSPKGRNLIYPFKWSDWRFRYTGFSGRDVC
jgi:hypothetical protein